MSDITLRGTKGSPLTNQEVDDNFDNLNTEKLQSGDTAASLTISSADINGGTIDGAVIGGTTAAAGSFTNITVSGTVDGRDVATDGTKLDGIEALADVTDTTNVTAAGALMDSELTNITAVKALDQGVATTDSPSFAGLTATTADINGGTIDGTVIGATTTAAGSFTSVTASGEIAANGGIALGDNDKATFGAGDHLQIYSDGTNGIIQENTGGSLYIAGADTHIMNSDFTEYYISAFENGAVWLRHDNSLKLSTTATGIDITGTATMGGLVIATSVADTGVDLTLNGNKSTNGGIGSIIFENAGDSVGMIRSNRASANDAADMLFYTQATGGANSKRQTIASNGDISFFEDQGVTPKFFWDASAESLGIGTSSPTSGGGLTLSSSTTAQGFIDFKNTVDGDSGFIGNAKALVVGGTTNQLGVRGGTSGIAFSVASAQAMLIDSSGALITKPAAGVGAVFNEDGVDSDFRVESDSNTHMLFVDGGNNAVGIGMASPTQALSIGGGLTVTASATLPSAIGSMTFSYEAPVNRMYIGDGSGYGLAISKRASSTTTNLLTLSDNGSLQTYPSAGQNAVFNEDGVDSDFRVESDGNANMLWVDASANAVNIGSIKVAVYAADTNSGYIADGGNVGIRFSQPGVDDIVPCATTGADRDNGINFGSAGARWGTIFAATGTIDTSDQNEKQDIAELSEAEQRVAVAAKGLLRKFRWKDSVAEKGDAARTHVGIMAQDLQAAFAAEGLDASDYAMWCSDTWIDKETGEERTRLGVRYSELLAFIISAI